jgi:uncharacterized protein HemX
MSIPEQAGKVADSAVKAMASTPLAIALIIVNVIFLGVAAYILGKVAENAQERNQTQNELITKLVSDIRDCRQGPRQGTGMRSLLYRDSIAPEEIR